MPSSRCSGFLSLRRLPPVVIRTVHIEKPIGERFIPAFTVVQVQDSFENFSERRSCVPVAVGKKPGPRPTFMAETFQGHFQARKACQVFRQPAEASFYGTQSPPDGLHGFVVRQGPFSGADVFMLGGEDGFKFFFVAFACGAAGFRGTTLWGFLGSLLFASLPGGLLIALHCVTFDEPLCSGRDFGSGLVCT